MNTSQPDVKCEQIRDNETWNTCPDCGKEWKDEVATPGLLHRTRRCDDFQKQDKGSNRRTG